MKLNTKIAYQDGFIIKITCQANSVIFRRKNPRNRKQRGAPMHES